MLTEYEVFEIEREKVRETNKLHLNGFRIWLKNNGLSTGTINKHVSNADLYINHYLCYYDIRDVAAGWYSVDMFFDDWFIRKCWATKWTMKSNAASIKKFYAYMVAINVVEESEYENLCETIKEEMPEWLESMREHNYRVMNYVDYSRAWDEVD